jgi:hypothetical protein
MANTLSSLGGTIFASGEDGEISVTLLADGTAKAGYIVGQTAGSGTMRSSNATGNLDETDGILVERYDTDIDTAPTAGKACRVIIPKAGRIYRVAVYLAAAAYAGEPLIHNTGHAGMLQVGGDLESEHVARLWKNAASGDNFAEVIWGA